MEVIEDYAFAGNQLIGITIPNSVRHIGNYAFAFNEQWKVGDIPGPDRIATIKTIIIKEKEQFEKVSKIGDILDENKLKMNIYKSPIVEGERLGPDVKLLNHIWVTSIDNFVIDVKYGPVGSGEEDIPKGYELAELEDFKFVLDNSAPGVYHGNRGYYQYIGTKEKVVIPHIIQDTELTDYYKMFVGTKVKGVASDNKNITNMAYMFQGVASDTLELKYLDTSSVENMSGMFSQSKTPLLDLLTFNTSNVTNMSYMFYQSASQTLKLTSFDTSKVTDMNQMFIGSQTLELDLSSFDVSKANTYWMFGGQFTTLLPAKAITGYARTANDAAKLNSVAFKPAYLTFIVKP